MTEEELIQELETIMHSEAANPDGYYTTEELAEMIGLTPASVRKRLKIAFKAGRVDVKKMMRPNMRGYLAPHTGYRIRPT